MNKEQVEYLLEERLDILSESQLEFLLESRIDTIKQMFGKKIDTSHDPKASGMHPHEVIDKIAEMDPTPNKANTQFLAKSYAENKDFTLGDADKVKDTLQAFHENKPNLEIRDITKIKSLDHMKDLLAPVRPRAEAVASGVQPLEKVFDQNGATGFKVPNVETMVHNYGPSGKICKARWCTASPGNGHFEGYKGGKYTLHLPDNQILHLHHKSNQLNNEQNQMISIDPKNPDPATNFSKHADEISDFVSHTAKLEGYAPGTSDLEQQFKKQSPDAVSKMLKEHDSEFVQGRGVDNAYKVRQTLQHHALPISDEDFETLKKLPLGHATDRDYTDHTAGNPSLTESQRHHIIEAHGLLPKLVAQDNLSPDIMHTMIGHILADTDVHQKHEDLKRLINSPSMKPEHFQRIINNTGEDYKIHAISNTKSPHVPIEYYHEYIDAGKNASFPELASNKFTPSEILSKISKQPNLRRNVQSNLYSNPKTPKEDVHRILTSGTTDDPIRVSNFDAVLDRKDITPFDADTYTRHVLGGTISPQSTGWLANRKLPKEAIDAIISHPKIGMMNLDKYDVSITDNPKVKADDLTKIINHPGFSTSNVHHVGSILSAKTATSKHIDQIMDKTIEKGERSALDTQTKMIADAPPKLINANHISNLISNSTALFHAKIEALNHPSSQLSSFDIVKGNPRFHGFLSKNERTPPSILHSLVSSPFSHVREALAKNPSTEEKTLQILQHDHEPSVSIAAKQRLIKD